MTVIEALNIIKTDLEKIPVRLCDMATIGNPIMNATNGLSEVIKAIENAEANNNTEAEADDHADYQNE